MSHMILNRIQEISEGIVEPEVLTRKLAASTAVLLNSRTKSIAVGRDLLIKVNTNVGVSQKRALNTELAKMKAISELGYGPDTVMDLSIVRMDKPFYTYLLEELGQPVGTLPHYLCFSRDKGIDPPFLLEEIERQAEAGVSWMTLHLTARRSLYEHARKTRAIPCASRGGGIVIQDMYINNRKESVMSLYYNDILSILKKNQVALSIGAVFRPATTVDALDEVHIEELEIQGEYIKEAKNKGVQVMMEGVGHISLDKILEYVEMLQSKYAVPFVPLGPLPTDAAIGNDHIASAIGASYMAFLGGAHLINSVTRDEHTGGVPSTRSVIEGLKAARIAAHSVNIARFPGIDAVDRATSDSRAKNYSCVVDEGLFSESAKLRFSMGCQRCGHECPLVIGHSLQKITG